MIFAVHNGTFAFKGGAPVLRDISFSIESGQILSILGPCGLSPRLGITRSPEKQA